MSSTHVETATGHVKSSPVNVIIAPQVDKSVFIPSMIVVIGLCAILSAFPEAGNKILGKILSYTTNQLGSLYLWFGVFSVLFLIWMAFGKYGHVKMGQAHEKPEFSTTSWVTMLFCAGIGSSLLYWGCIEWAYYYISPPFGIEAKSVEAANHAAMYGMFHWGIIPWAIYCLPTLPIGYAFYVKKIPYLRMSVACKGVIGSHAEGTLGKVIDVLFIFGLIGGIGTTLGLGTPMLSAGIGKLLGIEKSFGLDASIIIIWTIIFGFSVYSGLEKGIKRLSDLNVYIAFGLLLFMIFSGPTAFIFSTFTNSIGLMFQKFIYMSLGTDPVGKSGFAQGWTIFYWAWWIAYAPFMGLFVARISRGRTFKEVILAECFWGSLGCWAFFAVFGNTGLFFELNNIVPVTTIMAEQGAPSAIIEIIHNVPFGSLVLVAFIILAFIYSATTMDSAAFVLASVASKEMGPTDQPARWHRLFWAVILGVVALTLMYLGGLKVLQTACVVSAFPLVFIIGLSIWSLLKWLKQDHDTYQE